METSPDTGLHFGVCHCCRARGRHRSMNTEYTESGTAELYSQLLLECYGIALTKTDKDKLICMPCVQRLRDAISFRELVLVAECCLLDPLQSAGIDATKSVSDVRIDIHEIKTEVLEDTDDDAHMVKLEFDGDYDSVDDAADDYYNGRVPAAAPRAPRVPPLRAPRAPPPRVPVEGEAALLRRFPQPPRLPRAPPTAFMRHCLELRDKVIFASDLEQMLKNHHEHQHFLGEKKGIILNIITILLNSNACPFRSKTALGFPCLYCRRTYQGIAELRSHVTTLHENADVRKTLWKYGPESLVINVDITNLKCRVCNKEIPNLNELKKHLTGVHKKQMCLKYTDRILPFKLTGGPYECQVCACVFETFGSVERHMNVHFRNYVCKDCGNGFATKYRLKVHIKSSHIGGNFPCELCSKVFTSHQKHKTHVDAVHKMLKRFKCPQCSERFSEYFARQKHLVFAHGAEPIKYKCNVCDRAFDRRYTLSRHLKKDHLKEKNNECDTCGYKCFTVTELRVHMIKHVGERTHECSVCKKAYARKKTLKEHMKIHTNDRRHACAVCGQAFIQKCSLKGHIKTHHPEFNID